uniref:Protein archease-like n=1 Tax=Odontella aurita TaxID=265563 RepID=A0A7S4MCU1_9STRA|mmetsp:Transcript_17690/g.51489  ORF Transcript_17690/g.51489 Transcript_17690/m.51489 type:complete len:263 (+) Transcript_17690:29-817(+)
MANEDPLSQRTSGRRASRRINRKAQDKTRDDKEVPDGCCTSKIDFEGNEPFAQSASKNTETMTPLASQCHGPSLDIQERIDAAISERSGRGVGTVKMEASLRDGSASHLAEPEILAGAKYEYEDHTADIQLHSWGENLSEALSQLAIAMFGYMTPLSLITIDELTSRDVATDIVGRGHDIESLVFSFLDEWLFLFHDTGFIAKEVDVVQVDREMFVVRSSGKGERLDLRKHQQGTEVKAITYSNMQIKEEKGRCDLWVIVDI